MMIERAEWERLTAAQQATAWLRELGEMLREAHGGLVWRAGNEQTLVETAGMATLIARREQAP